MKTWLRRLSFYGRRKKLQKKDWEDFLRKEGMPAELPLLRMVSIEEVSERELVSARKTPEVSSSIISFIFGELVDRLVDRALTEEEREILEMWCYGRMSVRRIAKEMGISKSKVGRVLKRAKNKLREEWDNFGYI